MSGNQRPSKAVAAIQEHRGGCSIGHGIHQWQRNTHKVHAQSAETVSVYDRNETQGGARGP